MVIWWPGCEPEAFSPAQVPSPAATTTTAARTASQRGRRYQRGSRGFRVRSGGGGAPAGSPGPAEPGSRRWEVRVPPALAGPDGAAAATLPAATGSTWSPLCDPLARLLQENLSPDAPA